MKSKKDIVDDILDKAMRKADVRIRYLRYTAMDADEIRAKMVMIETLKVVLSYRRYWKKHKTGHISYNKVRDLLDAIS